jgi:hypothetical protein
VDTLSKSTLLTEQFIEFEKRHSLFEREIFSVQVWNYVRMYVLDQILKEKRGTDDRGTFFWTVFSMYPKMKVIKFIFSSLLFLLSHGFLNLSQRDVLVLNHPRRIKNKGNVYECIYTDPLLKEANFSYYVFEQPLWLEAPAYLTSHFSPVETKNIQFFDMVEAKFICLNFFHSLKEKLFGQSALNIEKKKIEQLCDLINEEFNVNVDRSGLIKEIYISANYEKLMRKTYEKILDQVKPKAILEFFCPIKSRQLFNKISRDKGIPIIELQHGSFGKREPLFYNFAQGNRPSYYPDYFLLFGDYWKNRAKHQMDEKNLISIGFPYLEQKLAGYRPDFQNKYQILFISQSVIGKKLSLLASELSGVLKHTAYEVVYKLHPYEYSKWRKEYPWLEKENILVVDSNERSIHEYFANALCQVGVYSTSIYEGIAFNLYTFIYDAYGSEELEDLYHHYGSVTLVSSVIEIAEKLPIIDFDKAIKETSEISQKLWRPHALQNFHDFMSKITAE